jgi:hypothetical protein
LLDFFSKSDQNAINLRSLKMTVVLKDAIMNFAANFLTLFASATLHSYDSCKNCTLVIKLKHIHKLY